MRTTIDGYACATRGCYCKKGIDVETGLCPSCIRYHMPLAIQALVAEMRPSHPERGLAIEQVDYAVREDQDAKVGYIGDWLFVVQKNRVRGYRVEGS